MLKLVLAVTTFVVLFSSLECTSPACGCWTDYVPSTDEEGKAVCKGSKTGRAIQCNEPEIPPCECTHEGKVVKTDVGITDCATINGKPQCDNAKAFEGFFERHRQYRIVH